MSSDAWKGAGLLIVLALIAAFCLFAVVSCVHEENLDRSVTTGRVVAKTYAPAYLQFISTGRSTVPVRRRERWIIVIEGVASNDLVRQVEIDVTPDEYQGWSEGDQWPDDKPEPGEGEDE